MTEQRDYVLNARIVSNVLQDEKSLGEYFLRIMASIQRQMAATAEYHGGEVVVSSGDTFMSRFSQLENAVNGAIEIMRAVDTASFPEAWQFNVKMGLGGSEEVLLFDNWTELAELARPRQILVTEAIAHGLSGKPGYRLTELPTIRVAMRSTSVWLLVWNEPVQREKLPSSNTCLLTVQYNGLTWKLRREGDTLSIGRDEANEIMLKTSSVSRRHAHIKICDGKPILADQSTNGTYMFPTSGKPVLLVRGEAELIGSGKISVEYEDGGLGENVVEYQVGA